LSSRSDRSTEVACGGAPAVLLALLTLALGSCAAKPPTAAGTDGANGPNGPSLGQPASAADALSPDGAGVEVALGGCRPVGRVGWSLAYKTGAEGDEQVWLWPGAGRPPSRISTWPASDRGALVGNASWPIEGLGRFGAVQVDHTHRHLLFGERTGGAATTWRTIAHDLQTGCSTILPGASRFAPLILAGPAATFIVTFDDGTGRAGVLWEWDGAVLRRLAEAVAAPPITPRPAVLLTYRDRPYISFAGALYGAPDGTWRRQSFEGTTGSYGAVNVSPDGQALCLIGHDANSTPAEGLIVDGPGPPRRLPDGLKPTDCVWSPRSDEVAFTSAFKPSASTLVGRSGAPGRVVPYTLLPGSRFERGGKAQVMALDREHRRLVGYAWETGIAEPIAEVDTLDPRFAADSRCRFLSATTSAELPALAVVKVLCGCPDCDDGASYAVDLASLRVHAIEGPLFHAVYAAAFAPEGVVTASVPQGNQGYALEPRAFFWTDGAGTRPFEPIGEVSVPRNPVVVPAR
jgi:hypothetical protein